MVGMRGESNGHTSFDAEKILTIEELKRMKKMRMPLISKALNAWPQTAGDNKAVPCTI